MEFLYKQTDRSTIPKYSILNFTHALALIIPGNVKNSDLTMPKSTFKNRLADYLLELQSKGDHNIWYQSKIFRSLLRGGSPLKFWKNTISR